MSYLALYRKWRPKDFLSVVGQEDIVRTLKNGILKDKISHAYLFSGVRGTGKTSIAKILGKALNCLDIQDGNPCNVCKNCVSINEERFQDIIEIDAASNRGIDEIRDIRDKINYLPSEGKIKIYIIDEVHMLTIDAFNALLKTLEEPPAHVVFVLATTEPQKIPLTVLSRCQRFDFKKIGKDDLINRLAFICQEEGGEIDDEALNLIAKLSHGGLRDAISLLDQGLTSYDYHVTGSQIAQIAGILKEEETLELLECMHNGNIKDTLEILEKFKNQGKNPRQLVGDMMNNLKNIISVGILDNFEEYTIVDKDVLESYKILNNIFTTNEVLNWIKVLNEIYINMKYSDDPYILFEISIINAMEKSHLKEEKKELLKEMVASPIKEEFPQTLKGDNKIITKAELRVTSKTENAPNNSSPELQENKSKATETDNEPPLRENKPNIKGEEVFKNLITYCKGKNKKIHAIIVESTFGSLEKKVLTILFDEKFKFHKERVMKDEFKNEIEAILLSQNNVAYKIKSDFRSHNNSAKIAVDNDDSIEKKMESLLGNDIEIEYNEED